MTPDALCKGCHKPRIQATSDTTGCCEYARRLDGYGSPRLAQFAIPTPLPLVIHCPTCKRQHVDEGEWATRPHRTHLCSGCGSTFRPALIPTVGVLALPLPKGNHV